ncbi:MAG: valine--tRNA ligase [Jatrophihabitans sp.]
MTADSAAADQAGSAPTTSLPTQYQPHEVEGPLSQKWEDGGYFTADPTSSKPAFSIAIPPPNVTGVLHLGHALEQTMMDAVTRRKRMQGFDALWLPGTDHAAIATETLVERDLAEKEGKSKREYTREEFIEKVWEWTRLYGGRIQGQMRRLGDSVDWTRERFTMDEGMSAPVQTAFKHMYDDGLIYRAERIVNWCPGCHTAISDIEVDHSDDEGELISIRYGEGDDAVVVATTRAETMLGDTAVAVHPDDDRYRHLVGTEVALPLTNRRIPIVADAHVDPAFGTGAVKVTPAHDPNDFDIGRRHDLPMLTVLDELARVTVHGPFEGMDRFEARIAVVQALREEGRIVAEKRPYLHSVGHCSRSDDVIEPRLSEQWFVKVETLAAAAGAAVRDGRTRIVPESLAPRYFSWVDNLHDWCISRQLWWGHRIPVWYSADGTEQVCLGPGEQPPQGWRQDEDVLDTWFSSGLWPFSTLGWPADTTDLRRYYPTSVVITGYDILFFWVVRMMLFGLYETEQSPFPTIVLHGLIRDATGKKMSKSKGNAVDPLVWMDAYGSDAVRLSLAQGANPGADQAVNEEWVIGARKFCNKLWNATRFALLNGATTSGDLPAERRSRSEQDCVLTDADAWILSRLDRVVAEVDSLYEQYEFAKLADLLYHFAWDEVFDWYVELAKVSLADPGTADATRRVLGEVFDTLLRLLHPLVPFVTEALWTELTGAETIVVSDWPTADGSRVDTAAEGRIAHLQNVVTEVRRFRSEQGAKPSQRVPARLNGLTAAAEKSVRTLLRLDEPGADFAVTNELLAAGNVRVAMDLSEAIDVPAERARLERARVAAEKERDQATRKLSTESFLAKAPDAVVESVRARLTAAEADLNRIAVALAALPV